MGIVKVTKSLFNPKLVMIVLLCCLLVACKSGSGDKEVKATFIGTIEELSSNGALVNIEESTGTKLSGTVSIDIPENTNETFSIGDKIEVGYNGEVMESAPGQVITITVEKIE